jgi:3-hydroxyacyl-CoA dehydrogenase
MCSLGEPLPAAKAEAIGLVDRLASESSLAADAIDYARALVALGPRPTRARPVTGDVSVIEQLKAANGKKWKGFDAPYANLACVEAATRLPFEEGMQFERAEFLKLMGGSQSAAQRHMFFAERQAAKIDGLPKDLPLRDVNKVGVIGAGTMGGGISMNFLGRGIPVTIVEMVQENLDRGVAVIRKNYEASAAKGRFTAEQVDSMMGILTPSLSLDDLADCDLVIEAVYESMDVKKDVFGKLDKICKPGAILASNTSYLDIDEIALATSRPQDVLGMHFFSPANVMKLLEVVRGKKTADDVLATAMSVGKKIGKVAVVAGVCHGFIGNRMLSTRQAPAMQLLLEGATPAQIDKVHTDFGMPMGPFQMSDLAGLDIGWHRDPSRIESIRDALCAAGRFGQKNGKGFYDYDDKRVGTPSAEALAIIEEFRATSNLPKRQISDQEIVERTLYPMVNEGHKILEEGKAQRASDIDVVWIYGYGWPVYRGGPMFWGELEGAGKIVEALERHDVKVAESLKAKA